MFQPELLEGGVEKNYNKACVWSLAILLVSQFIFFYLKKHVFSDRGSDRPLPVLGQHRKL